MSQNDRTQLIPDPQQPSRHTGGVQSPRPIAPSHGQRVVRQTLPNARTNSDSSVNNVSSTRQTVMRPSTPPRTLEAIGGPARKSAGNNKSGKKTTLFVVLGLIVIVYIVGVVAFSQVAYPNTTIAGRRRLVLQRFVCRHQGQLGMEAL